MSTGTTVKATLAPLLGVSPQQLDRYLAALARAGLIRRSGLGGGKAVHHLEPFEYANVLLSLAAPTPRTAADAAKRLGALFPHPPREGDGRLWTGLTATIDRMALDIRQGRRADLTQRNQSWRLALCVDPLFAEATWPAHGADATRLYLNYEKIEEAVPPPVDAVPLVRRQAVLTGPLLVAIAELCAETKEAPASVPGRPAPVAAPTGIRPEPQQADRIPRVRVPSTPPPQPQGDPHVETPPIPAA